MGSPHKTCKKGNRDAVPEYRSIRIILTSLLYRYRFGEVTGLINITAFDNGDMVGQ